MTLAHAHNNAVVSFSLVTQVNQVIKLLTETVIVSDSIARLNAEIRALTSPVSISDNIQTLVTKQGVRNVIKTLTETILTPSSTLARIAGKKRRTNEPSIVVKEGTLAKILLAGEAPIAVADFIAMEVTRAVPTNPHRIITENVNVVGLLGRKCAKWRKIGSS